MRCEIAEQIRWTLYEPRMPGDEMCKQQLKPFFQEEFRYGYSAVVREACSLAVAPGEEDEPTPIRDITADAYL